MFSVNLTLFVAQKCNFLFLWGTIFYDFLFKVNLHNFWTVWSNYYGLYNIKIILAESSLQHFLDILFPLNIFHNDRAAVGFPVCTKWDIAGPATPDWSEGKLPKRMF